MNNQQQQEERQQRILEALFVLYTASIYAWHLKGTREALDFLASECGVGEQWRK